ncbi:helix-turn-helix domain-containing protein [Candidatus Obscuribacterales bacterium]|nr:helix-turn-helix domain-containing protein [Candidatus Obscuribacterales bacterium]
MTQETPVGAAFVRSELLTRREAATYLGVSEQTLAIWKCTGRYNLPYIKIGRLVKYKKADLDAFIARNYKTASA